MSIRDWERHGDTNVGLGMVPSRSEREPDRQNRTLATMRARIEELTRERDALMAAVYKMHMADLAYGAGFYDFHAWQAAYDETAKLVGLKGSH